MTSLDTVWDASGRWSRVEPSLPHLDLAMPSLAEAREISGEEDPAAAASWFRSRGVGTVAVKMGADGCYVAGEGFDGRVRAPLVRAVDGTGAGDAFAAGLLSALLDGRPLEEAARFACAAGAFATTAIGAFDGVRGAAETLALAGLDACAGMTLVGLDVGTTAVKALAVSPTGEVLERVEREYPLSTPRPGWSEQDPEDWVRAAESALAEVGADAEGIGLSGQMHGLVCLDAAGKVLRPAILWNDQRTGPQCAEIEERVGFERLIELTGNRALPGFTAPKLLWVREHEPEVYARIAHVLLPKDYVRLRLTGEYAMDVADASGTLLLDVGARRWSDEVLDALDVDRAWLPPLLESPQTAGTTPAGIAVAAGAGDQAAGAVGVGVDRPGPLSVVLGTSGVVFAALPAFAHDATGARTCSATPCRARGMRWG